jgi:hypothetical protein
VDATAAIAELRELSTQIETVVVIARDGSLVASSVQDEAAHRILGHWLAGNRGVLDRWELPGVRVQARLSVRYDTGRVGVAYGADQVAQQGLPA